MGRGRSAFLPGSESFTPTKAVYIGADQTVTFIFRLQQGGGPYILVKHSNTGNKRCCKRIKLPDHTVGELPNVIGRPLRLTSSASSKNQQNHNGSLFRREG